MRRLNSLALCLRRQVRILFEIARQLAPSTIFIDEIDAMASSRGASGALPARHHQGSPNLPCSSPSSRPAAPKRQDAPPRSMAALAQILLALRPASSAPQGSTRRAVG